MPTFNRPRSWAIGGVIALLSIASHAQHDAHAGHHAHHHAPQNAQVPTPARATDASPQAHPTDVHATVPALRFESALRAYRPLVTGRPVPWAQANERVNQIGGWRTYTREAHAPEPAAATPDTAHAPKATPPSPENPHAHH